MGRVGNGGGIVERKDKLLLFAVIVAAGLVLHERGEMLGGVSYDPVGGTVLIYLGYGLVAVGGALWLYVITRPIWRRQIPLKYKLLQYGTRYAGDRAPLKYRTTIKIDLCGHPLPEAIFVECDAPIQDAVWEFRTGRGASFEGWVELIPQSPKTAFMRLQRYSSTSVAPDAALLAVSVMAHDPIEILRLRPRRLPSRLSTPTATPPPTKSES